MRRGRQLGRLLEHHADAAEGQPRRPDQEGEGAERPGRVEGRRLPGSRRRGHRRARRGDGLRRGALDGEALAAELLLPDRQRRLAGLLLARHPPLPGDQRPARHRGQLRPPRRQRRLLRREGRGELVAVGPGEPLGHVGAPLEEEEQPDVGRDARVEGGDRDRAEEDAGDEEAAVDVFARRLRVDRGQPGPPRVPAHPLADQHDRGEVRRVEHDDREHSPVLTQHLAGERDQHQEAEVQHVQPDQPVVERPHLAEERVVDEPEASDHREADRVGEQRFVLFPERVGDFAVLQVVRDPERQHQQRDRDREHPVAEGDDARELDLVLLPLLRLPLARHRRILAIALDGTAGPATCGGG